MVSILQNHPPKIFLTDHHWKTQSELIDIIENSQIWMLFYDTVSNL